MRRKGWLDKRLAWWRYQENKKLMITAWTEAPGRQVEVVAGRTGGYS